LDSLWKDEWYSGPRIFQEMMELLCEKARHTLRQRSIICFWAHSLMTLDWAQKIERNTLRYSTFFFQNSIRIKISKCEILQTSFEYLGSHLEWNAWSPSRSKISAILNIKIKTLKDLRGFLGACNFYCRYLKKISPSVLQF